MQIAYVDGPRFRRSIADHLRAWRLAWTADEPEAEDEELGVAAGGRSG